MLFVVQSAVILRQALQLRYINKKINLIKSSTSTNIIFVLNLTRNLLPDVTVEYSNLKLK